MYSNLYSTNINNTYSQTNKSSATLISLSDMKLYLRVDDTTDDLLISAMISAAVTLAEKYMNRDLLETTYENYRNDIEQDLTLRRAKFSSLDSIEYLKDSSYNTLNPSSYQVATKGIYGRIWEVNINDSFDEHPQAIKITFKTGFGPSASNIPDDILMAIKAHVAYMYENRGDCETTSKRLYDIPMPVTTKLIYDLYKIVDVNGVY